MQSIEQRVERLERSAARWRAACLLTLLAVGAGVCIAAIAPATRPAAQQQQPQPPQPQQPGDGVIRGRSILLSDGDGSPTVHIYAFQSEAGMMVESNAPDGRKLVWLAANGKEASAGVVHEGPGAKQNRIELRATEKEQEISVSDKNGPRSIRPAWPPGGNP